MMDIAPKAKLLLAAGEVAAATLLDRIANGEHPLSVLASAVNGPPAGWLGSGEGEG